MTISAVSTRKARGIHTNRSGLQQSPREKSSTQLPEYLEAHEVQAIIQAAPHTRAKLLVLTQWRAALRMSEALALTRADLSLETDLPTIRVRNGKGRKARVVPVHPELQNALGSVLEFTDVGDGRIIDVDRSNAWRWVHEAKHRSVEQGVLCAGRRVGSHTLRHSYARHVLLNGIPLNYLRGWMRHADIKTTLIYLELVPDATGSPEAVP